MPSVNQSHLIPFCSLSISAICLLLPWVPLIRCYRILQSFSYPFPLSRCIYRCTIMLPRPYTFSGTPDCRSPLQSISPCCYNRCNTDCPPAGRFDIPGIRSLPESSPSQIHQSPILLWFSLPCKTNTSHIHLSAPFDISLPDVLCLP